MCAIIDTSRAEEWPAEFALVLADRPEAEGLAKAAARGIPTACVHYRDFAGRRPEFDRKLIEELRLARIDWVVLAGFMRILGAEFLAAFPGRVLNIHPSLLPKYPGLDTHARALAGGEVSHGCTVHLVSAALDAGPIVGQARVPVLEGDTAETLAERVLVQEHILYPEVVRQAISGQLGEPAHPVSPREEVKRR
jgi:phosphoribosylglycinamide formyltransferase-1